MAEPYPSLNQAAGGSLGLVGIRTDSDGVLRSYLPYAQDKDGNFVYGLALAAVARFEGATLTRQPLHGGDVQIGGLRVPVDDGRFLVNFPGPPGTHPTLVALEVLRGESDWSLRVVWKIVVPPLPKPVEENAFLGASECSNDEKDTLRRLGLGGDWRMACMARVQGPVTVNLAGARDQSTEESSGKEVPEAPDVPGFEVDTTVRKVVIIGNRVAGVTVADDIRRYHPDCEITLVAREPYNFYNRMAVSKLIYDGTDLEQIVLPPPTWAQDKLIDALLGSAVVSIDPQRRVVGTGRGRFLEYDRPILATGSYSFIPPIEGWGISGGFALRHIDDALGVRDYARLPPNTSMPWSWAVACWGWERPMPWAVIRPTKGLYR